MSSECNKKLDDINEYLFKKCISKENSLDSCDSNQSKCPCSVGSPNTKAKVDLVVLMDTSGSMSTKAQNISNIADKAIKEAQKKCPTDLRIEWFGVGGVWNGTKFITTHRNYINGLSLSPSPVFFSDTANLSVQGSKEEGADACADIAKYFDWRDDACRAVLYISDEPLDQGSPQNSGDDSATQNSIAICNSYNVSAFNHLVGGAGFDTNTATIANYQDLSKLTGAKSTIGGLGTEQQYNVLLQDVICNACGGCKSIKSPNIEPCISISWGDSSCDCLETDDLEVLCISICNCYSNISFNNFTISMIEVTDSNGNTVENLPDGTPSVQAIPIGPICFGSIEPCTQGSTSCVNREFSIHTRGAKDGEYQVKLHGICFDVSFNYHKTSCFKFNLCKS